MNQVVVISLNTSKMMILSNETHTHTTHSHTRYTTLNCGKSLKMRKAIVHIYCEVQTPLMIWMNNFSPPPGSVSHGRSVRKSSTKLNKSKEFFVLLPLFANSRLSLKPVLLEDQKNILKNYKEKQTKKVIKIFFTQWKIEA